MICIERRKREWIKKGHKISSNIYFLFQNTVGSYGSNVGVECVMADVINFLSDDNMDDNLLPL